MRKNKLNGIMLTSILALIIAFVLNVSARRLGKKKPLNLQSHLNRFEK